jgi:3-hydroxyacyl-[acyl-carrier-protein] dehydratase
MLLNDFFIIDDSQTGMGSVSALLHLDVRHPIFAGHFPGRPVVPGVCLLQLVQELTASINDGEVRLIKADYLKFITPIDPVRDGTIAMTLTGKETGPGEWQVTAEGSNAGAICFRFKGSFRAGSDYAG